MKRGFLCLMLCVMAVIKAAAAYTLTASSVTITDVTVDKNNFFVLVKAATSTGEYEVGFDVWPAQHSAIGSFNADDKTIGYVSSYVHKTKANGSAVNMWYYPDEGAPISLSITQKDETTCTLSGSITASRNGTAYTYNIPAFDFAYAEGPVDPEPEKDPYRFEPETPTTINFTADVIHFRQRSDYIEVTLNEMANETYDWIDLRLLSDTMDMPAGTYTINDSYTEGTLTASKGYLNNTAGDDPCYVAIRIQEEWGQYTPYYLESGNLTVRFNTKGDTIFITGTAFSHNGSTINVNAKAYNMLYVEEEQPKEPEFVNLAIDTVVITYLSNLSDSANNIFYYTFNFSKADDYPTVLTDVILSKPMELVAGTYTLANSTLDGLQLSQNQTDFEANIFAGGAYNFVTASLTLTPSNNGQWRYEMVMNDDIGSEYTFAFSQTPHIILYPEPVVNPEDQPYTDEQKEISIVSVALDTIVWDAKSVSKDGVIDIYLTQLKTDSYGLRAYMALGMYASQAYPAAGTYPVNGTEEDNTFSASMGRYGNILFPCYLTLMDDAGWAHAVWYIVDGNITLSYEGEQPILSGECTSYFGSIIKFAYRPAAQGIETINDERLTISGKKIIQDGQLFILRDGKKYSIMGQEVR